MRTFASITLISITLFCTYSLFAQNRTFKMVHYSVDEGLPSSEVYHAVQANDGKMWFASEGGVSRFDGYTFTNFTTKEGLTDNTVFRLYEDLKGRMWYMSFTGGIGYFQDDSICPFPYNEALRAKIGYGYILNLTVDSLDNVSFATHHYGFGTIDSEGVIEYSHGSPDSSIYIRLDRNGPEPIGGALKSMLGKGKELRIIDPSQEDVFVHKFADTTRILRLHQFVGKEFFFDYMSGEENCIGAYSNRVFKKLKLNRESNSVFKDRFGRFWVCIFRSGIFIYENEAAFFNGEKHQIEILKGKNVSWITEDKSGGVWLSIQDDGVVFIPNIGLELISTGNNARDNEITGLEKSSSGQIYASTISGKLYEFDDSLSMSLLNEFKKGIHDIQLVDDSVFYISLKANRLNMSYHFFHEEKNNFLFKSTPRTDVLVRSNRDVLSLGDRSIRDITNNVRAFNDTSYYYDLEEDEVGRVWVGGKGGLFLLQKKDIIPYSFPGQEQIHPVVRKLEKFSDHQIVAGVDHLGLFFIQTDKTPFVKKVILLNEFDLSEIYEDDDGDLWVGSERGITWIKFFDNGTYSTRLMNEQHGLSSNKVNAIISKGDTIFVGTSKGITVFRKSQLEMSQAIPDLSINRVEINMEEVDTDSVYALKYRENNLNFSYSATAYRSEKNTRYAFKLEGIDQQWNYTTDRTVRYHSLEPGTYVFKVKVANEDGVWSNEEVIKITIDKPVWLKWWFIPGVILIIGIVFWLLYRRRAKIMRREHKRIQQGEIQKRKTAEARFQALRAQMNPHFTFNSLNSIQSYILNSKAEEAADYVARFSRLMRKVLYNSNRDFISVSEELEVLELYILFESLRLDREIQFDLSLGDRVYPERLKIPSMILQPIIENAIIHGLSPKKEGELKLSLEISLIGDFIKCTVTDNGVGRVKSEEIKKKKGLNKSSLGIIITKERLQLLDEQVSKEKLIVHDLIDKEGNSMGTSVDIYIKKNGEND